MKVSKVVVTRGKKLNLENYDNEQFEIQMEAILEDGDDPQDIIQGLKSLLDRHLISWEQQMKGNHPHNEPEQSVRITTAEDLISNDASDEKIMKTQSRVQLENSMTEQDNSPLICPKCNEVMIKKEGKDYYLCGKHWGYPDMIRNGQVREKRF